MLWRGIILINSQKPQRPHLRCLQTVKNGWRLIIRVSSVISHLKKKCFKFQFIKYHPSQGHVAHNGPLSLFDIKRHILLSWVFTCVPESVCTELLRIGWLCRMNLVLHERFMRRKNPHYIWDWKKTRKKHIYTHTFETTLTFHHLSRICFVHFIFTFHKIAREQRLMNDVEKQKNQTVRGW